MIDNIQFNFGLVISEMDTEEETSYTRLVQCSHILFLYILFTFSTLCIYLSKSQVSPFYPCNS